MTRISLLMLPGLLCDEQLWAPHAARLGDAGIRTHIADLTQDDTMAGMAERAVAPMPERFAIAALSMGGYVTFEILRRFPGRVSAICLFDTSARPDTREQARRRRGLISFARVGKFHGVNPRLLPQLLHPDHLHDRAIRSAVMDMALRVGKDAFIRQQTAILGRPDSRPDLPGLAIPALICTGDEDRFITPDHAEEMAAAIPGAALRVVPRCGHLPPLERPDEVSDILLDWMAAAAPRT